MEAATMPMKRTPVDTAWFRAALRARGLSQRQLARQMRLDPSAVSLMLRGRREIRTREAQRLAEVLGTPLSDVLSHSGIRVRGREGATVALGGWIDGHGAIEFGETEERVERPPGAPTDSIALVARTLGGPLHYMDRWLLYIDKPRQRVADCVGRLSVVQLEGAERPVLAYVYRGLQVGTFALTRPPSEVPDQPAPVEWATPIIWIRP